jgi:hypothetical protein
LQQHLRCKRLRRPSPRPCAATPPSPRRNPMTTMAPTRPAALPACRVRLTPGPAAAAEARAQVQAAIGARDVPVDGDVAVLVTAGEGRA